MDKEIYELSKAMKVINEIGPKYGYSYICKINDNDLEKYKRMLHELDEKSGELNDQQRGKKLEDLVSFLLEISGGIFKVERNIRTSTNELDQLITLSNTGKMLKEIALINEKFDLFLGECKNYNKSLSVTYVGKFCSLLLTTNIKLGIIFSFHGISGSGWKNGHGLVRKFYMSKEKEKERFCIIDFSYKDFISVANGNNFLQIIDDKLKELRIDTSYEHLISKHQAEDEFVDS